MAVPAIVIRVVRSPKRQRMLARMGDAYEEILKTLRNDIGKKAQAIAEDVVSNWKNKPKFVTSPFVEPDSISIFVEPIGPNAKYWEWTSRGTRPHIIQAKNKPFLIFRKEYEPKTTVGPPPTWGNSGKSSGDYVRKVTVQHPGTEPRHFEEYIGNELKNDFRRKIENAFRRGVRRS